MSLQNSQVDFIEQLNSDLDEALIATPAHNLTIYRNNIETNLINALKDTYPLIVKLLGEDFFALTASEYIKQYPSRSPNLHEYGEYFSDFLAEFAPVHDFIYLSEVACFEWITHNLYFAANHPGFDFNQLAAFTPGQYPQLHLSLNPASHIMQFYYPILKIIDLCNNNINETININDGGIKLLIIRRELEIKLLPLTDAEFEFLNCLQNNDGIDIAFDRAARFDNEFDLHTKLQQWIQDKTIVDVYIVNQ